MENDNTPRTDRAYFTKGATIYSMAQEMKLMEKELEQLQKWKDETLEVESQWDVQAVGEAMGLTIGERICPAILPYIRKLQGEIAEARSAVKNLTHSIISAQGVDAVGRCVELIRRQEEILGPLGPINDFRLAELLSHALQLPAELRIEHLTKQRDILADALHTAAIALRVAASRHDEDRGTTGFFDREISIVDKALTFVEEHRREVLCETMPNDEPPPKLSEVVQDDILQWTSGSVESKE